MKPLMLALFAVFGLPVAALAANESNYKYCLYAGYFGIDSFLGGLSVKLIEKHHLLPSSICSVAIKQGYEVSKRIQTGDTPSEDDARIMFEAKQFSDKAYEFIIKGSGL